MIKVKFEILQRRATWKLGGENNIKQTVQSKLKGDYQSARDSDSIFGVLMWTSVCVCSIILPPNCVFIFMSRGGRSQNHSNNGFRNKNVPKSLCQHWLSSSSCQSAWLFLVPCVQLWGISSYFGRLGVELQHFAALCPRPITIQTFLRTTAPPCSVTTPLLFQSPPIAILLYNMRDKVIITADGNRRVSMKWAAQHIRLYILYDKYILILLYCSRLGARSLLCCSSSSFFHLFPPLKAFFEEVFLFWMEGLETGSAAQTVTPSEANLWFVIFSYTNKTRLDSTGLDWTVICL